MVSIRSVFLSAILLVPFALGCGPSLTLGDPEPEHRYSVIINEAELLPTNPATLAPWDSVDGLPDPCMFIGTLEYGTMDWAPIDFDTNQPDWQYQPYITFSELELQTVLLIMYDEDPPGEDDDERDEDGDGNDDTSDDDDIVAEVSVSLQPPGKGHSGVNTLYPPNAGGLYSITLTVVAAPDYGSDW